MARTPTENESMALAYMMFFMQARLALGANNVQLSWILNNNPLLQHASMDDKNDVRRGIEALVVHQLLIQDEQGLWLSNLGQIFFEYASGSNQSPAELEEAVKNNPDLVQAFAKISADTRFNPPRDSNHIEAVVSKPTQRPTAVRAKTELPSSTETTSIWNIWTILLFVMVGLGILKLLEGVFK